LANWEIHTPKTRKRIGKIERQEKGKEAGIAACYDHTERLPLNLYSALATSATETKKVSVTSPQYT
jgi:hypothetical protein